MNIILKWDNNRITIEQFANMCKSYSGLLQQHEVVHHLIDMVATMVFDADTNEYIEKNDAIKTLIKLSYYDFSVFANELKKQQEESGLLLMAKNLFGENVEFVEVQEKNDNTNR